MVFAAALQVTGCVEFIMKIAYRIGGNTRAGPAQIAIISSGMRGMVSGSSVANVASTGALTITLRKRVGLQPDFAGAVDRQRVVPGKSGTVRVSHGGRRNNKQKKLTRETA